MIPGSFQSRHIGPDEQARDEMLGAIGVGSLDELIDQTIPPGIRLAATLDLPAAEGEHEYLQPSPDAGRSQSSVSLVHRHGLLRHAHAERHPAERVRKSRLVHALHALPGRDCPGPARIAAELSDRRQGSDGDGHRDGVAARRRHGGGGGDDDVPQVEQEGANRWQGGRHVHRLEPVLSADARRPARQGGTARDRARSGRCRCDSCRSARPRVRRAAPVSGRPGRGCRSARADRESPRGRRARRGRDRSSGVDALDAARRDGR